MASLEKYVHLLEEKLSKVYSELETGKYANETEAQMVVAELSQRLAQPVASYKAYQETITDLEKKLDRFANHLDPDQLQHAKTLLHEDQDYTLARELLESMRDKAKLAKEDADKALAEIEFELGIIAAAEIRWHDAATHYGRAARLNPTYAHLRAAREFLWRAGQHTAASALGDNLITAAITEFGENSPTHASALNEHAISLNAQGKYDLAEPLYLQAIEIDKNTIGEAHPNYATGLNNLALLYEVQGKNDLAEPLYLQAIEIGKKTIGETHPNYAIHLNNLAELYRAQGKYDLAEPLYLQAKEITKKTIGEAHPDYAIRLNNLAGLYRAQAKYDLAEPLFLQAIEITQKTIGEAHPSYAIRLNNLAGLYYVQGKYDLAEPLYLQAIEINKSTLGDDHPHTMQAIANYEILKSKMP